MQMTEQEYKDLMAHFYRRETDRVIERLEEEYKQYVKKYF